MTCVKCGGRIPTPTPDPFMCPACRGVKANPTSEELDLRPIKANLPPPGFWSLPHERTIHMLITEVERLRALSSCERAAPTCSGCGEPMQRVEYRCGSCGTFNENKPLSSLSIEETPK